MKKSKKSTYTIYSCSLTKSPLNYVTKMLPELKIAKEFKRISTKPILKQTNKMRQNEDDRTIKSRTFGMAWGSKCTQAGRTIPLTTETMVRVIYNHPKDI